MARRRALVPVLLGFANGLLMAVLWALYMSFVHVGQVWYGYGWEIQLLETGFLAIFLCPLLDPRPFPRRAAAARGHLAAALADLPHHARRGLIKLRGDPCWRDLTCLYYHYETQPIPNPLSRTLHFMPRWFHRCGVLFNHLTELVAPWFVFGPRRAAARRRRGDARRSRSSSSSSGNLSFLNWLTIVPVLACFDDALLARLLPAAARARAPSARGRDARRRRARSSLVAGAVAVLVAVLSIAPVREPALAGSQVMNTSFDRARPRQHLRRLRQRRPRARRDRPRGHRRSGARRRRRLAGLRVPVQARRPDAPALRRSRPISYRLDWQIWFAAMSRPEALPVVGAPRLEAPARRPGRARAARQRSLPGTPPRFIRATLYRYASRRPAIRAAPGGRASASGAGSRRSPRRSRGCGASSSPTTGPSTTGRRPARASRVRCRAATRAPRDRRPSCGSGRPAPSWSSTAGRRWRWRRAGPCR